MPCDVFINTFILITVDQLSISTLSIRAQLRLLSRPRAGYLIARCRLQAITVRWDLSSKNRRKQRSDHKVRPVIATLTKRWLLV